MYEECDCNMVKFSDRVGRKNDRKRDAKQANLPERSPSLRTETRNTANPHFRAHPYLPPRANTQRQRKMIRPSSAVSMSGQSLAASDYSGNESEFLDVDEEMGEMSLDSPLRVVELQPRPFPDKHFYWMNDYETLKYINQMFSPESYYIMHNGKIVEDFQAFVNENRGDPLVRYSFHFRLRGGKGGFGSLLRSFRVNKSTNKLMMRDLNGRRMASVDEEAKLKRYLEKQARKEQEMKEKRKIKLAKLTAGPAKHQFEDQDYLSRREEIIERTENACEAGFAEMRRKSRISREQEKEKEASDDEEENAEEVSDLFNDRGGRKRKIAAPTIGESGDKKRIEDESEDGEDSEDDSENEPDAEELAAIRKYFEEKTQEEKSNGEGTSASSEEVQEEEQEPEPSKRPRLDSASNVDDLPKIDEKTPCEYGPIDLDDFTSAADLELLGLEHLKSALNDRLLKCGGSLPERAARLWSVKGKAHRDWPKNILTPELKKKIAEEEEAERKAAKKAKKAKKN